MSQFGKFGLKLIGRITWRQNQIQNLPEGFTVFLGLVEVPLEKLEKMEKEDLVGFNFKNVATSLEKDTPKYQFCIKKFDGGCPLEYVALV